MFASLALGSTTNVSRAYWIVEWSGVAIAATPIPTPMVPSVPSYYLSQISLRRASHTHNVEVRVSTAAQQWNDQIPNQDFSPLFEALGSITVQVGTDKVSFKLEGDFTDPYRIRFADVAKRNEVDSFVQKIGGLSHNQWLARTPKRVILSLLLGGGVQIL